MSNSLAQNSPISLLTSKELVSMVRAEITIGNRTVLAFMDSQGNYFLNQTQITKLLGKDQKSSGDFLDSMYLKALIQEDHPKGKFKVCRVHNVGNNISPYYTVWSLDLVSEYISYWADRDNQDAINIIKALFRESLKIRCEAVFVGVPPNVVEIHKQSNDWLTSRNESKSVHAAFSNYCKSNAISGKDAHNLLTMLIFGQTAAQAKIWNDLIGDDENVGPDHQESTEGLAVLSLAKIKFCGYRSRSWQENCDRAVKEAKQYLGM